MKTTDSVLTKSQSKTFGPRTITLNGERIQVRATVCYDDRCGNGHNTFSITGDCKYPTESWEQGGGGCIHEEIAAAFPELAPFIKWHLCSSDGPMHYIANTTFHASDKDCWGLRKGEVKPIFSGGDPTKPAMHFVVRNAKGEQVYPSAAKQSEGPFTCGFEQMTRTGEGKEPDLRAARHCAIWPDATLEQLQDKAALEARLPALMEEFRAAVESLGFTY